MVNFIDGTSSAKGTPLNRANMMAVQGFENSIAEYSKDSEGNDIIIEHCEDGSVRTIKITDSGVTENFVAGDGMTLTLETYIDRNGILKEELK